MKFFALILLVSIQFVASGSKNCPLKKNKLVREVKQYQKKCLNKGFESSIGCTSANKQLGKKWTKKCKKIEARLKKCGHSCPINGGWSNFGEWSNCSANCGGGIQTRTRTCDNPAPAFGGIDCVGDAEESQRCNESPCPINGGWTSWEDWTKCSAECGGGSQTRKRSCANPAPAHGGLDCVGDAEESQKCNESPCPIGGWRKQTKNLWFRYNWDSVPLEVKTTSAKGGDDEIFFEVADKSLDSFARVVVRMSEPPIYYVHHCQHDTPLYNFPEAQNNVRVWRFTKLGNKSISIHCNGVLVAELEFAKATDAECVKSGWATSRVHNIKFNPDWDKTVGTREICEDTPPAWPGVSRDREPPILFGDQISLSCSEKSMVQEGARHITCNRENGSELYSYVGDTPSCKSIDGSE